MTKWNPSKRQRKKQRRRAEMLVDANDKREGEARTASPTSATNSQQQSFNPIPESIPASSRRGKVVAKRIRAKRKAASRVRHQELNGLYSRIDKLRRDVDAGMRCLSASLNREAEFIKHVTDIYQPYNYMKVTYRIPNIEEEIGKLQERLSAQEKENAELRQRMEELERKAEAQIDKSG